MSLSKSDITAIDNVAKDLVAKECEIENVEGTLQIENRSLSPEATEYLIACLRALMEEQHDALLQIYSRISVKLGEEREWKEVGRLIEQTSEEIRTVDKVALVIQGSMERLDDLETCDLAKPKYVVSEEKKKLQATLRDLKKGKIREFDLAVLRKMQEDFYEKLIDRLIRILPMERKIEYFPEKIRILLDKSGPKSGLSGLAETGKDQRNALHFISMLDDPSILDQANKALDGKLHKWIDQPDKNELTALGFAIFFGKISMAEELLSYGADIDFRTRSMDTILFKMITAKKEDAVEFCLKHGSDPLVKTAYEMNALHYAAFSGDPRILERLLAIPELKSRVTDQDLFGRTPLMIAMQLRKDDAIRLLGGIPGGPGYGVRPPVIRQEEVWPELRTYLSLKKRSPVLPEEGHCHGFGFLAQYYAAHGRVREFVKALELISSWDETSESLKEKKEVLGLSGEYSDLEDLMEQWVNDIVQFQHLVEEFFGFLPTQYDRVQQFETVKKREDANIEMIFPMEYFQQNREQLEELLEVYTYFPNLTFEFWGGNHNGTGRVLPDGKIWYYDSNFPYFVVPFESIERLSTVIQNTKYRMLGKNWKEMETNPVAYKIHTGLPEDLPVKIPSTVPKDFLEKPSLNGWTRLHLAILFNDIKLLEATLKDPSVDIQTHDKHGLSPLRLAIHLGKEEIVARLLADPRTDLTYATHQENLLKYAIGSGNQPICRLLIARDDLKLTGDELTEAVEKGNAILAEALLSSKHDVDVNYRGGLPAMQTSLQFSIAQGNLDLIKLLFAYDAKLGIKDIGGDTPLSRMSEILGQKLLDEVLPLLEDVNFKDDTGSALIHYAARNGNLVLIKMLKAAGADLNLTDVKGLTPLQIAEKSDQEEAIALLKT